MWKSIRGWFKDHEKTERQLARWKAEARFWRDKYRNLKKYVEDIESFHSYED